MSIFTFLDYRLYFEELFKTLKKANRRFSYRAFARMAGSTSPNFLQLILQRKLRINPRQLEALIESAKFTEKEARYLRALVAFDHSSGHDDKNKAFREIITLREYRSVSKLAENQYEYLSNWYNPAVRELICSPEYDDNPESLVSKFVPTLGLREIKKSIKLLESLELVHRNEEDNGWSMSENAVATPPEVLSIGIIEYHREMLSLASKALENVSSDDRDIRAVTLGIPKSKLPLLKERMEAFWREMMDFSDEEDIAQVVVQVNTQLFPLTKLGEE